MDEGELRFFPIFTPNKLFAPLFRLIASGAIGVPNLSFLVGGSEFGKEEWPDEDRESEREGPLECGLGAVGREPLAAGTAGGGLGGSEG